MAKKLTLLTQYFYPEINSTAKLLYELAEDLNAKGIGIEVYAKRPAPNDYTNLKDDYNGIIVHRIKTTNFSKTNFIGRSVNYVTFFLKLAAGLLFSLDNTPCLVLSSPPFLPLIAYFLKRLRGRRYFYLVHDLYPDVAVQLGYLKQDGWLVRLWSRFNARLIKEAEQVIVLDESMKRKVEVYAAAGDWDKIVTIPNWADGTVIKSIDKADNPFALQQGLQDKFVILYAGNFGLTHNLEVVMKAAECLRGTNAFFLFVGAGAKKNKLIELKAEKNLENVRILPFQPYEVLPDLLSTADLSLIVLDKGFNGLSVPSKLYSILASGRGILAALEPGGEVEKVIKEAGCGVLVAPDDLDALVAAIKRSMQDPTRTKQMGINARQYFEANFDRTIVTAKYNDLIERLL
jgi:colanic acid biosynthesis glycosyl transferase WcaI